MTNSVTPILAAPHSPLVNPLHITPPTISSTIPQNRPGRTTIRKSQTIDIQTSYGTSYLDRAPSSLRVFFQNTKGLTYSSTGEDYDYYLSCTKSLGADLIGMAETNTAWQHPHLRSLFHSRARNHYSLVKTNFSSPTDGIDPVPEKETFQSGGTITMTTGDFVPMVYGENPDDSTGLGRWSSQTIRGKHNKIFTAITGYRVCSGSIATSPIGSAFSREYEYHRTRNITAPRPRKLFLSDLQDYIQHLQDKGHAILLMLDSNGQLHDDIELQHFVAKCDLHDLHKSDPAPSTYIGSDHRRIDHMLGCSATVASLQGAGSLSYLDGPQSDHRGLFVDLDTQTLFAQTILPMKLAIPNTRPLKSGNPESIATYHRYMLQYYAEHNMVKRIKDLRATYASLTRTEIKTKLEKWDNDQGRAMQHSEQQLRHSTKAYEWSPALRDAGLIFRYWRLRLREIQHNENYAGTFKRIMQTASQHNPSFRLPFQDLDLPLDEIRLQLKEATATLKLRQKDSVALRFRCYMDLLSVYENDTNPNTKKESLRRAKIVRNTIRSEQSREMYRNLRNIVKPMTTGGLTNIQIPRHKADPQYPEDFKTFLSQTEEDDIVWDTVLDKDSIDAHLLKYNRHSFRAAAISPCGHGQIHDSLTFNSLSPEASAVLEGSIPADWYGHDNILREFLTSFAIPASVKETDPISTDITTQDVSTGFKKWKETTSTSPSGRHLGHYKALIQDPVLLQCLTDVLHITVNSGLTLTRWSNAVNIMIEKDAGEPKITRLRIIHLFEADFNFFLKLIWGSRLVKRSVHLNLLHDGQHGSVPRRTTMEPIMLTQLTTDLCRLLKRNLARFDNDASACYDRIIVALGMLAARRCGMPDHAVQTHADCLELMKYTVKTAHGISEDNYQGTPFSPLFGTGQGSGASPAVWLTLVVTLMKTLDRLVPERMQFESPDTTLRHSRLIDAFVDDTSLGYTDAGYLSLETLIAKLNHMAQTWENLLFYSGGALNLSKCSWYVLYWDWKSGRPQAREIAETDRKLQLTTQGANTKTPIKRYSPQYASRILGVHLAPDGNFSKQLAVLKAKADDMATRLRSPKLTPQDIKTFHRTMYAPAMRYVLPALAVDEEELAPVQTQVLASMLQKLGYSSKTPTAIRHGPIELGGLDLMDLRTELGISNLKLLRDAIYRETESGKLMLLTVKYSQIEAGISEPLLEHPNIHLSYVTPSWIMSIRHFMSQHNITVTITDTLTVELRGATDACIMDPRLLTRYTPTQQKDINLVRLYLQVITLSDITTADGVDVCSYMLQGSRRPGQHIREKTWPRQALPTASQKRLWRNYISSNYLRYGTKWKNRLQPYNADMKRRPHIEALPRSPTHHPTLRSHIKSLPTWYRRLLFDYTQLASDLEVWREFRARRKIVIASDGSLKDIAGTFGWKITTSNFKPLFKGSGPVDGPLEIGSSTRSELGGFTAPLLLVTMLARHWGLKHRCSFRWLADSRVAIDRVTIVTRKDHSPFKQPDNVDYVSVIRDLFKELRRPMQTKWVKSHQDSTTSYENLTSEAKLNVDADELATLFHSKPNAKPMRKTQHIPSTRISISILKTRYAGNLDANLRYHINGGYLRGHLQKTNTWADTVWETIDTYSFGRHMKRIQPSHQQAHVKLIHNLLPLGSLKFKCSAVADVSIKLCPCCKTHDEDTPHLLQCIKNPAREEAQKVLMKTLLSDSHPSRPAIASCIDQYLRDPTQHPTFQNDQFPRHLLPALEQAMLEQSQVGWHQLLLGFFSKTWLILSAADHARVNKPERAAGQHRIHQILSALSTFTRTIWLGRNEALHSDQDEIDNKVYSVESAALRHYHGNPTLLSRSDQHYCDMPLQRLLKSGPSVRRRWLRRVRQARASFLKNGQQQQRITQFMEKKRPRVPIPPAPDIVSRPGLTRTTSTQQRMTAYFPGRPPDLAPAPINPSPTLRN